MSDNEFKPVPIINFSLNLLLGRWLINCIFSPKDILESIDLDQDLVELLNKEEELKTEEEINRAEIIWEELKESGLKTNSNSPNLYFIEIFETQEQKAKEQKQFYPNNVDIH